jgi:hypothetical protein
MSSLVKTLRRWYLTVGESLVPWMLDRALGSNQSALVALEAVQKHSARPLSGAQPERFAPRSYLVRDRLDQLEASTSRPRHAASATSPYGGGPCRCDCPSTLSHGRCEYVPHGRDSSARFASSKPSSS